MFTTCIFVQGLSSIYVCFQIIVLELFQANYALPQMIRMQNLQIHLLFYYFSIRNLDRGDLLINIYISGVYVDQYPLKFWVKTKMFSIKPGNLGLHFVKKCQCKFIFEGWHSLCGIVHWNWFNQSLYSTASLGPPALYKARDHRYRQEGYQTLTPFSRGSALIQTFIDRNTVSPRTQTI